MKTSFLGDSITFGYGLDNKEKRYSSILCKNMGAVEANFGITKTMTFQSATNYIMASVNKTHLFWLFVRRRNYETYI